MKKINLITLAIGISFVAAPVLADNSLPVVPVSVTKNKNQKTPPKPVSSVMQKNNSIDKNLTVKNDDNEKSRYELSMLPGVNELLVISQGHLNRFVTPFDDPVITTVSDAVTMVQENVVYISTDKSEAVTVYITENGDESTSLSLTLVPRKVPPREVFLVTKNNGKEYQMRSTKKAQRWESSQSYVDTIREAFRFVALGQIPSGYSFVSDTTQIPKLPSCRQQGMEFDFTHGQSMMGHSLNIVVGTASNISKQPIEFREMSCGSWETAAVAAYPKNVLNPGEVTEIYIAQKVEHYEKKAEQRNSLLNEGK